MAAQRTRPIATTITVDSLSGFLEAIEESQRELSSDCLWFRGHESVRWKLVPSIYRKFKYEFMHYDPAQWSHERTMFVKFQSAAYSRSRDLPEPNDVSKWLCLMRHYGLSTRLLDWSRSPLVAAYFALKTKPFKTPTIWILNPDAINEYYKTIAPILILRDSTPDERLANHLTDIVASSSDERSVLAVNPPEVDNRILSQRSVFTIHGNASPLHDLKIDRSYLVKVRFTDKGAKSIAGSLKLFGYEDSVIFPDLEHLAAELASIYGHGSG